MLKKHIFAILLIAASSFLVYSNTLHSTFHFDDVSLIVENPKIKDLNNLREIMNGQRGLSMSTFALNYAAGGLDVFGYHIVNIVIHVINGVMVYFLIFLSLNIVCGDQTGRFTSAEPVPDFWSSKVGLYSALIFAVHPVQTQAVTYIVQRMETLASMFYLLALLLFIKGTTASRMATRILLYGGVVASYILGFKSKEIAITLPIIIFLYDFYFLSGGKMRELSRRWPLYAMLGLILVYLTGKTLFPAGMSSTAQSVLSGGGFNDVSESSAGFGVKVITPFQYLYTQFNVIMTYLRLIMLPVKQNLDYDYPISQTLFEMPTFISFICITGIVSAAFYFYAKPVSRFTSQGRVISFFIFWFFIIILPTSSFIPIQDVIFEHRVYLASVGFIAIFVVLLDENIRRLNNRRQN